MAKDEEVEWRRMKRLNGEGSVATFVIGPYIDVNYYNIRDLYERNLIIVSFVPSADIAADSLTKPFIKDKYKAFKK